MIKTLRTVNRTEVVIVAMTILLAIGVVYVFVGAFIPLPGLVRPELTRPW